jgi:hypothetical protein
MLLRLADTFVDQHKSREWPLNDPADRVDLCLGVRRVAPRQSWFFAAGIMSTRVYRNGRMVKKQIEGREEVIYRVEADRINNRHVRCWDVHRDALMGKCLVRVPSMPRAICRWTGQLDHKNERMKPLVWLRVETYGPSRLGHRTEDHRLVKHCYMNGRMTKKSRQGVPPITVTVSLKETLPLFVSFKTGTRGQWFRFRIGKFYCLHRCFVSGLSVNG